MLALLFRDRMNLKAPIYFSTGLTEKVLSINEKCPYYIFRAFTLLCVLLITEFTFTTVSE